MTLSFTNKWIITSGVVLILLAASAWFFFSRFSTPSTQPGTQTDPFGVPVDDSTVTPTDTSPDGTQTIDTPGQTSQTKIFQITPGPVVGATLIQILHPTTTLVRYIKQEDGHVFDLPLDVSGALPRVVSNVTIPGGKRAIWVEGGSAAVMQYLDGDTVKSVYLGFPAVATSSATRPTRIVFLPDSIVDIAASPDGKSIVYMLKTAKGVDGYITKPDGTNNRKVFSLPLSQVLISWPSTGTLLAQTKSTAGLPGIAFSVDVKTGAATALVYAPGLTATADSTFSKIIYQTTQPASTVRSTYVHDIKKGIDRALSLDPYPEKCIWPSSATSTMYCAVPLTFVPVNYLDLWHLGAAGVADTLMVFDVTTAKSTILTTPGSSEGGVASDIFEIAASPNEKYISFTNKGSRSLWGVRLSQ